MDDPEALGLDEVCSLCGATDVPLEWHEPAGRANSMLPRVRVCRPCHAAFYLRQLLAGIDLKRDGQPRTQDEVVWAVMQGVCHHFAAMSLLRPALGAPVAASWESLGRGSAVAVEVLTGPVRHPGPDPIASDRRSTYRGQRSAEPPARSAAGAVDTRVVERAQAVAMLQLVAQTVRAGSDGKDPTLPLLEHAAQHADRAVERLEELWGAGEADDWFDQALSMVEVLGDAMRTLVRSHSPADIASVLAGTGQFVVEGDAIAALLAGLAE